jgi:hypothetical protein
MKIESDARKRIVKAIALDKEISALEMRERLKGKIVLSSEVYNENRRKLVEVCCEINSVANSEGKGRDDLTVDILISAENISRRISNSQSRAVRNLAERIKKTFVDFRQLMKKYDENLEVVDPQLKSNPDLVEVLNQFEKAWEKGKEFFMKPKVCNMLIHFSRLIEGASEKYKEVQEKIEAADTDIFVIIPCLVVLNSLDGDDKGLCKFYYPAIAEPGTEQAEYENVKSMYESMKKRSHDGYKLYNILEQLIIEKEVPENLIISCATSLKEIKVLIQKIKRIAMEMQRHNPSEWNALLEAAMGQI